MSYTNSSNLVRSLSDRLKVAGFTTLTTGVESSGAPFIQVGGGTAGSQSAYIRIQPLPTITPNAVFPNVTGAADSYSPTVTQVVLETSTVANLAVMTAANLVALLATLAREGTRLQLYMTANTTAATSAGITGTPVAEYTDLRFPGLADV